MATKIDHLGIGVRSLAASEPLFAQLLGVQPSKREVVESEGVEVSFFQVGESRFELLQPTGPESPFQAALDKRGEGIATLALETDDIDAEVARLKEAGVSFHGEIMDNKVCKMAFAFDPSGNMVMLHQIAPDRAK